MNEINPKTASINKISSVVPRIVQKNSFQKPGGLFNELLTSQLEKNGKESTLKEVTTLPEIQGSFKAQQLDFSPDQTQLTQKLEDSLDLFETYASWLGDPEKTLKQTHGLLEQVLSSTKALALDVKEHGTSSTDLNQILTQLMTTAQVEQIKLNRGDYSG
ncbi:hypothetical protein [Desulfobacula toluolica]|uniref:Uncharacterized protein n=1 Tax=Desulfobacula toluolica (strain DSM 7467 / Tol2) TaxID=651182 RepID=K0NNF0_DESTT|nr:hypothetical protein [Desulfobacula toluolica]CCK80282.1 uncharacterized protein TOL2_C21210 [Desulfobacula toluolica Tol2]